MHCIDRSRRCLPRMAPLLAGLVVLALLGCARQGPAGPMPPAVVTPPASPSPQTVATPRPAPAAAAAATPAAATGATAAPTAPASRAETAARAPRYVQLAAPVTPRNATELRMQLARRLVAAHPDTSYMSPSPDRLLAIPVLEIELNANGSVRSINVLRKPSTGNEATVLAIDAVRRAAPYGDVSRLPKPWKVVETFLFDDNLRFKPRTLDTN